MTSIPFHLKIEFNTLKLHSFMWGSLMFFKKRRLPLRVSDLMSTPPITAGEETPIEEIAKIMWDNRVGSVMITDSEGVLVGIVTERDILYSVANNKVGKGLPACMVMTENPVTVTPDTLLINAIDKMRKVNVRHLPVVNNENKPVGMLSLRDVTDVLLTLFHLIHG